jgi:hypothetical protein
MIGRFSLKWFSEEMGRHHGEDRASSQTDGVGLYFRSSQAVEMQSQLTEYLAVWSGVEVR